MAGTPDVLPETPGRNGQADKQECARPGRSNVDFSMVQNDPTALQRRMLLRPRTGALRGEFL
jgi:hypothetical protein